MEPSLYRPGGRLLTIKPWTFFLVALVGWMNRQQQQVIQYLRRENLIVREKLGKKRLVLNEPQKQRLPHTAGYML